MAVQKAPEPDQTIGYQLTIQEAQALLDYLAERPFKEVFLLVSLVTARPVYESVK